VHQVGPDFLTTARHIAGGRAPPGVKPLVATFLAAASLGLAAGAVAAPTKPPAPKPKAVGGSCATPDEAACLVPGFLDTPCGRAHVATCKPFIIELFEQHHEAAKAPTVKMLRPKASEMPTDLRVGSYYPYVPAAGFAATYKTAARAFSVAKAKPKVVVAGKSLEVRTPVFSAARPPYASKVPVDALGHVDPNVAAKAHRNPAWDANGATITDCEEYAYEANYDALRFADAAAACRGDRECIYDVAYMAAAPGIATRTLADKDGEPLSRQMPLATGVYPKNDLFVAVPQFVRANGLKKRAATPKTTALESALATGNKYYSIGACSGGACDRVRKFRNEWDWHETLHDANAAMSLNEYEEFERRRAKIRELFEQYGAAIRKEGDMLSQAVSTRRPVLPYDAQTFDLFERYDRVREIVDRPGATLRAFERKFGKDVWTKPITEIGAQVHGSVLPRTTSPVAAMGVLASPAPHSAKTGAKPTTAAGRPKARASSRTMSDCLRPDGWGLELSFAGPISCRIGELLRQEWDRKESGKRSCLDLNDPGCDWWPVTFQDHMVGRVPLLDRQQADHDFCDAWRSNGDFPATSVASLREKLNKTKELVGAAKAKLKDYELGSDENGSRYGKTWKDADYAGDKHWFAAGWRYNVGWTVESRAKDGAKVCELSGDVHADTGFDAWVFGSKVPVVRGEVRGRTNHGGDHKVSHHAHLEIIGDTIFSEPAAAKNHGSGAKDDAVAWSTSQPFSPDPSSGAFLKLPDPAVRFYIGAYISGKLWGELVQGVQMSVTGDAATGCNANDPVFRINASYAPFFGAYAMGQVGAGIADIASAGVRVAINLVMVGLPVEVGMRSRTKNGGLVLTFTSEIAATLASLSGRMSAYVEIWPFEEEWEVFRWSGLGPVKIPLMPPLGVDLPMQGMQ
jgi:hypothetical protein